MIICFFSVTDRAFHRLDTLADAPHSALSGVARVLVHAGKLNAKTAEELVRSVAREARQLRRLGHRAGAGLARRPGAHAVDRAGPAAARPERDRRRPSCRRTSSTTKLASQYQVVVLGKRGNRLFIGGADPTDQEARRAHQVRDPAHARVGDRRARQARSSCSRPPARAPTRRWSRCPRATSSSTSPTTSPASPPSAGDERRRGRPGRPLPAEDADRRDQPARLRPALRALRVPLPRPLPRRRRAARDHAAAARDQRTSCRRASRSSRASTSPRSACRRTAA